MSFPLPLLSKQSQIQPCGMTAFQQGNVLSNKLHTVVQSQVPSLHLFLLCTTMDGGCDDPLSLRHCRAFYAAPIDTLPDVLAGIAIAEICPPIDARKSLHL